MILAGDVGGTKMNLALCEVESTRVTAKWPLRYSSAKFPGISDIIERYLTDLSLQHGADPSVLKKQIKAACFGVPGPVIDGRCQTVNLPWTIDVREIKARVGITALGLINDLESMAYGVGSLEEGRGITVLRAGRRVKANQALIAPGTGLGEALIVWHGDRHVVSPSEGGHCDFSPHDEEHIELLRWLWPRHPHVSWEHVASGPGIFRIYRFLRDTGRDRADEELERELASGVDPSPVITARAIKGDSTICVRTLDLWLYFLGAEAGNLALKSLCRGGLFIGGGVIPNIIELFRRPAFFLGLENKGRMSGIIKDMPIYAVTDQYAAIYGAAISSRDFLR